MNLTKHAEIRKQQRGFSDLSLKIIEDYRCIFYAVGRAEKYFLGNRECNQIVSELKKTMKMIERAKGGTLIISGGKIVTVYRQ